MAANAGAVLELEGAASAVQRQLAQLLLDVPMMRGWPEAVDQGGKTSARRPGSMRDALAQVHELTRLRNAKLVRIPPPPATYCRHLSSWATPPPSIRTLAPQHVLS